MRVIKRLLRISPKDQHRIHAGSYPYLVTGCGRSGTHFIARFLELNGLDIGHEVTGAEGAVGWLCASPAFCEERGAVFTKKAHQIRHPANAIRSILTMNGNAYRYFSRYVPEIQHPDRIISAARYWVHWNRLALDGAELSVRLEDFQLAPDETVRTLSDFFGRDLNPCLIGFAERYADSRKSRREYAHDLDLARVQRNDPATWAELERLAHRFGYDPHQPL